MKVLYCAKCQKECGHIVGEGPARYDRGWIKRVIEGRATVPDPAKRFYAVGAFRYQLPLAYYICDLCGAPIHPGDRCATISMWRDGQPSLDWESEFIER